MKKYTLFLSIVALMPFMVGAQTTGLMSLLSMVSNFIGALVPIVISIAVLVFLWGIVKYVVAKSEEQQKEARTVIFSGIVILFVMVSVWGLVNVLIGTLGLNTNPPVIPSIPVIR